MFVHVSLFLYAEVNPSAHLHS